MELKRKLIIILVIPLIGIIGAVGIFENNSFYSQDKETSALSSGSSVLTPPDSNNIGVPTQQNGVWVVHGHAVNNATFPQPALTTTIVPDYINMTKGSSESVTVNLHYKYVPGINSPNQLVVTMVPEKISTLLNIWANLPADTVENMIETYEKNDTSPPGLYNMTNFESYSNPGPLVINANETKSVIMTITLPSNLPADFNNRTFGLNADARYSGNVIGIAGEITVKVIG